MLTVGWQKGLRIGNDLVFGLLINIGCIMAELLSVLQCQIQQYQPLVQRAAWSSLCGLLVIITVKYSYCMEDVQSQQLAAKLSPT